MSDHLTPESILELVANVVDEARRRARLAHAQQCDSCEEALREAAAHWETLSADASRLLPRRRSWRGRPLAYASALAAAVALLLFWFPKATPTNIILTLPELGSEIAPRADDTRSTSTVSGVKSYQAGDYADAITQLSDAVPEGPLSVYRDLYRGSAQALSGDYGAAAHTLDGLPFHLIPEPWSRRSQWTLQVAWRELGQLAKADSLCAELQDGDDEIAAMAKAQLR